MIDNPVPTECPPYLVTAGSEGTERLMMFRFPAIPGVPPLDGDRTLYGALATNVGNHAGMPEDEWWGCVKCLAGEISRADYHYKRFQEVLHVAKERRKVAGGPVFGDPEAARAIYCEAVSYLTAVRTLVDLIVFIGARRAGVASRDAEKWEPSVVFSAQPSAKYQAAPETPVLGRYADWFNKVNDYRNCMNHRGWREQSFGYFNKADTAIEVDDPFSNVMLLPDLVSLGGRARPHQWTYKDRAWLDDLVVEVERGLRSLMLELYSTWGVPETPPGTVPEDERPNVFLTVPLGRPLGDETQRALYVFITKPAAKAFFAQFERAGFGIDATYRAIRSSRLSGFGDVYLAGWDPQLGDPEVRVVDCIKGRPVIVHRETVVLAELPGAIHGFLPLKIPGALNQTVYVLGKNRA